MLAERLVFAGMGFMCALMAVRKWREMLLLPIFLGAMDQEVLAL